MLKAIQKNIDSKFFTDSVQLLVGCDEAGRGCLLGPVVAGAVIFPRGYKSDCINDSKLLTEKEREQVFEIIKKDAIAYGIGIVSAEEIDEINILEASKLAMEKAIENMKHDYDFVITDAIVLPHIKKPQKNIIKGDSKSVTIAAASILAKVTRDHICYELDEQYPEYGIKKHKGYATEEHIRALKKYGPKVGLHRFSFEPVKDSFLLDLFSL